MLNWFSFLSNLKEPMGPSRRQLICDIYDGLLKSNEEGKVDLETLLSHFHADSFEECKNGKSSREHI